MRLRADWSAVRSDMANALCSNDRAAAPIGDISIRNHLHLRPDAFQDSGGRRWWFLKFASGTMLVAIGVLTFKTHLVNRLPAMMSLVWPLLIYWLVIFVACFVVVEIGQDQLYDEVTPHAGLKVASGSLLIAVVLTALRYYGFPASFESMFTTNIAWTLLQGVVWFCVFTLILQFHPWHALGLGTATMLMISGLATMGVESILAPRRRYRRRQRGLSRPRPFDSPSRLLRERARPRRKESRSDGSAASTRSGTPPRGAIMRFFGPPRRSFHRAGA